MSYYIFKEEVSALILKTMELDVNKNYESAQSIRREIESKIAAFIIHNATLFAPEIEIISQRMISLLEENREILETKLSDNLKKIICALYHEEAFGRLPTSDKKDYSVEFIINILKSSKDLPLIMHLHSLIGQDLIFTLKSNHPLKKSQTKKVPALTSLCAKVIEKTPLLRQALRQKFYLYKERGRHEQKSEICSTTQIGIADLELPIGEYFPSHIRAMDRFIPDQNHSYYKTYIVNSSLPFVAGPSGHAGILLRTATLLGNFTSSQMQNYLLAIIGMIVGGGMHSTHEIMLMTKQLGFSYETGDYQFILRILDKLVAKTELNNMIKEKAIVIKLLSQIKQNSSLNVEKVMPNDLPDKKAVTMAGYTLSILN